MRFLADPALAVVLVSQVRLQGSVNVTCPQIVRVDSTTLACIVPSLDGTALSSLYGRSISLPALFPCSELPIVGWSGRIVASPESPVVKSVRDCEANNGSFELLRCRGGDLVMVNGAYLLRSMVFIQFVAGYMQWSCLVLLNSAREHYCQLPYLLPEEQESEADVPYTAHYQTTDNRVQLNYGHPFTLTWTWDAPTQPTESGSSSRHRLGAGLLSVVAVKPVLAVLVAVAVVVVRCRWRRTSTELYSGDTVSEPKSISGQHSCLHMRDHGGEGMQFRCYRLKQRCSDFPRCAAGIAHCRR